MPRIHHRRSAARNDRAPLAWATLPFIEIRRIEVGGFTLHVLGLTLIASAFVAYAVFVRRAVRVGLTDRRRAESTILAVLLAAAIAGHASVLGTAHPFALRAASISSALAGVGALLATLACIARFRLPLRDTTDALAYAFAPSMLVARVGCALTHDHRGIASNAALAVAFPSGARYDPGLLEAMALVPLALGVAWAGRRSMRAGALAAAVAFAYGALRFGLDFLRADDPRHAGLTLAQWSCLVAIAGGAALLVASRPAEREGQR